MFKDHLDKSFKPKVTHALIKASQPWLFTLRLLVFWLSFFLFFRLWFIVWLRAEWQDEQPWMALWQALPLDISMAGYLIGIPLCLWFVGILVRSSIRLFIHRLIDGFNLGVIIILVFIFGANIFIYEEWHTPLNNRAFEYFRTPGAMLDSMSLGFKVGGLAAYVVLSWVWWRIYQYFSGTILDIKNSSARNIAWAPLIITCLILSIRGGIGKVPINESAVYYSTHLISNHAATNAAWHMMHSLFQTHSTENRYRYYDDNLARKTVDSLYRASINYDDSLTWLRNDPDCKTNVLVILMESMTGMVIQELGGIPDICPNLSKLIKDGILFENIYGSGYRTDQGLVSVLSGFPALPDQSMSLLQDKGVDMHSMPSVLSEQGYATAFLYGGQLSFANLGLWLRNQQVKTILSGKDFSEFEKTQRWGADDKQVFKKSLDLLQNLPQPFFATILTLSLHTPYDVPFQDKRFGDSNREKFLNSAVFADQAIGEFMEKAAREPWFKNTLIVLVADHGHYQPKGYKMDNPLTRHIPMIFTGPLIDPSWCGRRNSKIGNHHDIAATILPAIGISAKEFTYSKNLFNPFVSEFAYYSNENGLGWVSPKGFGFYQFSIQQWQKGLHSKLDSVDQRIAKSYLQTLYTDYLAVQPNHQPQSGN